MKNTRSSIAYLVQLAALTAILLLLAFTPLGYLKVGPISITFLTIPVAVGAVILGPAAGATLGGIFGLTSLVQCFGMDWFGTTLYGLNPIFTILLCLIPRILAGLLPALLSDFLLRRQANRPLAFAIACTCAALLNTLLFSGALVLFFGTNADFYAAMIAGGVILQASIFAILAVIITSNAVWEAIACCMIGGSVATALSHFLRTTSQKRR